jgi:mannose-6-phosphate isomerase
MAPPCALGNFEHFGRQCDYMEPQCLTFYPLYKERVWGGRKLQTHFGRILPGENRVGEAWELVDREDEQSIVCEPEYHGATLHELWTRHRVEIFGDGYNSHRFPIIAKILDASDKVSLQVHPAPDRITHVREEAKAEIWYFLATEEGSGIYAGLKQGVTKQDFESAIVCGRVAELVHYISSRPHSHVLIPSGRLHAIGAGNVMFEIQQNSDTTYRVFDWNRIGLDGQPRQLHVEESLRSIDFNDFEPALGEDEGENLVNWDCFRVDRWLLTDGRPAHSKPRFSIFQVASGKVFFGDRLFGLGDLFLVPANWHSGFVRPCDGPATVLRTTL